MPGQLPDENQLLKQEAVYRIFTMSHEAFQRYHNTQRVHATCAYQPPIERLDKPIVVEKWRWKKYCHSLCELPIAVKITIRYRQAALIIVSATDAEARA